MAVTPNSVDAYVTFLRRKLGPRGPRGSRQSAASGTGCGRPHDGRGGRRRPVPPNEARLLTRTRWRLVALSAASTLVVLVALGACSSRPSLELARGRGDRPAPRAGPDDRRRYVAAPATLGPSALRHRSTPGDRPASSSAVRRPGRSPSSSMRMASRSGWPAAPVRDASPLLDRFAERLRGPWAVRSRWMVPDVAGTGLACPSTRTRLRSAVTRHAGRPGRRGSDGRAADARCLLAVLVLVGGFAALAASPVVG